MKRSGERLLAIPFRTASVRGESSTALNANPVHSHRGPNILSVLILTALPQATSPWGSVTMSRGFSARARVPVRFPRRLRHDRPRVGAGNASLCPAPPNPASAHRPLSLSPKKKSLLLINDGEKALSTIRLPPKAPTPSTLNRWLEPMTVGRMPGRP